MGRRGFVAATDITVTQTGELRVRTGGTAPQVPVADGPTVAVRRTVHGALEAFPDDAAIAVILARGPVQPDGASAPLTVSVPVQTTVESLNHDPATRTHRLGEAA